jgi:hypothetical protein
LQFAFHHSNPLSRGGSLRDETPYCVTNPVK